ncbi:MAG TPA: ribbon-helix-helix protein, CopG family [Thermoanaerobaculia bacterium]|jgi:metal-responsive CopG/Arc/MetJ family transcriptional regulator|nr:ribbon-helix-helix protein, CopG family [Thermoanaerobaculia bacterium]
MSEEASYSTSREAHMQARRVRTTVALSADLLAEMDAMVGRGAADSRNAFLERAIRQQLAASRRAAIDAEFAQMANDSTYQKEAVQVAEEFAASDWEALRAAERNA